MIEEIRIDNLGVIGRAHVELGPGLTVLTGETGAGKTMVLTALNLLLGGKADPATVRVGSASAAVEGRVVLARGRARRSSGPRRPAPSWTTTAASCCCGRSARAPTARRAGRARTSAVARCRRALLAELADELVTVHGQADQARLRSPAVQREALDEFVGAEHRDVLARYRAAWAERARVDAELTELVDQARDRTREAELLRLGLAEVERVDPQPDEDVTLAEEVDRLSHAEDLRTAAAGAHAALVGERRRRRTAPPRSARSSRRAGCSSTRAPTTPRSPRSRRASPRPGTCWPTSSTDLAAYLEDLQADPLRLDAAQRRRAELGTLTRSYGSTVAEVLAWADTAGRRLLDLDGGDERIAELREAACARSTTSSARWRTQLTDGSAWRRRAAVRRGLRRAVRAGDGRCRAAASSSSPRTSPGRTAPTGSRCCSSRTPVRPRDRWARARPAASCPA